MLLLIFLYLFLLGAIIALVFTLNTMINLFRDKVPYVSTPKWAIDWLTNHLPLTTEICYDLGCGDARVLIALKKRFPGITAIGYERNWWPLILAKAKIRGTGIIIHRQNFYHADLSDANIVFCFLIHSVMPKVEQLLHSQLQPGATIYSYGFTFPTWQPVERIPNPRNPTGSKINVYRQSAV
jgi:hypothetical protein